MLFILSVIHIKRLLLCQLLLSNPISSLSTQTDLNVTCCRDNIMAAADASFIHDADYILIPHI